MQRRKSLYVVADELKESSKPKSFSKNQFLALLEECLSPSSAAIYMGYSPSVAQRHKKNDAAFSAKWDEIMYTAVDDLEGSMLRRAIYGWKEPVFYQGTVVGHVVKYSTSLQTFMIKNLRPEKYSDFKISSETAEVVAQAIHNFGRDAEATMEMPRMSQNGHSNGTDN